MMDLYTKSIPAKVGVAVSLSFLVVIDLIGNTLVILIILTNKSMKSPMNYLLVNLAVADMMVGMFLAPQFVFSHFFTHPDGVAGTILCKVLTSGILAWVSAIVSTFTLVAVACERFFAIVYPYSTYLKLNMKRLKVIVIFIWPFAIAFNLPSFITTDFVEDLQSCSEQWSQQYVWLATSFSVLWLVFVGIIPFAIMFVLYSKVIYTLWFKQNQVLGTQLAILKSRKKITKMMVTVSVVYAVCWFPILFIYFFSNHHTGMVLASVPYVASVVMAVCNSAINPFIYTLQSERFRRLLIKLLCCRKERLNHIALVEQGRSSGKKHNTAPGVADAKKHD